MIRIVYDIAFRHNLFEGKELSSFSLFINSFS